MIFRLTVIVFFFSLSVFSQDKYTRHTIAKGDNLSTIAQKYDVKIKDIQEANPNAPKVLKLNSVLLIPNKNQKSAPKVTEAVADSTPETHKIQSKETLWGIAKKYKVSVDDLKEVNPLLETEGLKVGQQINIPVNKKTAIANNNSADQSGNGTEKPESEYIREVLPKETKYSIAKQYGITTAELEKQNPEIKGKLPIGYVLTIRTSKNVVLKEQPQSNKEPILEAEKSNTEQQASISENEKPVIAETAPVAPQGSAYELGYTEIIREVLPKETKYSIAKQYGITVAELEKLNPNIKQKLPVGSVLTIRTTKQIASTTQSQEQASQQTAEIQKENVPIIKKDSSLVKFGNHSDLINLLIVNATENIGTRYRSGGTTRAGFDCSGLMYSTFGNFDVKLPRTSIEMSRVGMKVDTDEAQKGDLIFFKTNGRRQINHVGMVVEVVDGEIKFVHSSTHGGVMISSTREAYYGRNLSQVNRVLE